MPMEYFEQRERALLGDRFDVLYAAPQETAEPIPTSISIKINTRIPLRISVFLRRLRRRS